MPDLGRWESSPLLPAAHAPGSTWLNRVQVPRLYSPGRAAKFYPRREVVSWFLPFGQSPSAWWDRKQCIYGLPVVAFDAGGIKSGLIHEETASWRAWMDTRSFASHCEELLRNKGPCSPIRDSTDENGVNRVYSASRQVIRWSRYSEGGTRCQEAAPQDSVVGHAMSLRLIFRIPCLNCVEALDAFYTPKWLSFAYERRGHYI